MVLWRMFSSSSNSSSGLGQRQRSSIPIPTPSSPKSIKISPFSYNLPNGATSSLERLFEEGAKHQHGHSQYPIPRDSYHSSRRQRRPLTINSITRQHCPQHHRHLNNYDDNWEENIRSRSSGSVIMTTTTLNSTTTVPLAPSSSHIHRPAATLNPSCSKATRTFRAPPTNSSPRRKPLKRSFVVLWKRVTASFRPNSNPDSSRIGILKSTTQIQRKQRIKFDMVVAAAPSNGSTSSNSNRKRTSRRLSNMWVASLT